VVAASLKKKLRRGSAVVVTGRVLRAGEPALPAAPRPSSSEPTQGPTRRPWREWPWKRLALGGLAALLLGLATLTVLEAVTGKPVSSVTGGGDSGGTTVGRLVPGRDGGDRTPSEDPSPTAPGGSPSPSPTVQPSDEPSDTPTPTPEPSPTVPPTDPSESPAPGSGESPGGAAAPDTTP
jgi:hypothetical protein